METRPKKRAPQGGARVKSRKRGSLIRAFRTLHIHAAHAAHAAGHRVAVVVVLRRLRELKGVTFGENATVLQPGTLRIGDAVEVAYRAVSSSGTS